MMYGKQIGLLGIRKKYRGRRAGRKEHQVQVRVTSREDYGRRRLQAPAKSHNPLNCI